MKICLLVYLMITSYQDWKHLAISVKLSVGTGVAGLILRALQGRWDLSLLSDLLPGVFGLLLTCATGGAVGTGDDVVLLVAGILSDAESVLRMLTCGLFLSAIWSVILFRRTRDRKAVFPFVPFLLAGQILTMLLERCAEL